MSPADHPFLERLIREFRGEISKALNAVIQTPGFALLILTPSGPIVVERILGVFDQVLAPAVADLALPAEEVLEARDDPSVR